MSAYFPVGAVLVATLALWASLTDLVNEKVSFRVLVLTLLLIGLGFVCCWRAGQLPRDIFLSGADVAFLTSGLILAAGAFFMVSGLVSPTGVCFAAIICLWMGNEAPLFAVSVVLVGCFTALLRPTVRRLQRRLALLFLDVNERLWKTPDRLPAALRAGGRRQPLPLAPAVACSALMVMSLQGLAPLV